MSLTISSRLADLGGVRPSGRASGTSRRGPCGRGAGARAPRRGRSLDPLGQLLQAAQQLGEPCAGAGRETARHRPPAGGPEIAGRPGAVARSPPARRSSRRWPRRSPGAGRFAIRRKETSSLRIDEEGEVGQGVLHLLPRVEPHGADEAEADPQLAEALLELQRLRVHPVEDRRGARGSRRGRSRRRAPPPRPGPARQATTGSSPAGVLRPEGLSEPALVVGHHRGGHVEDGLRGAVVALQADDLGPGEDLREGEDVARPPPRGSGRWTGRRRRPRRGRSPGSHSSRSSSNCATLESWYSSTSTTRNLCRRALPHLGMLPQELEGHEDEVPEVDVARPAAWPCS